MKKRLLIILILVLFLTGCSCEYNLKISDDGTYSETVNIIGENNEEIQELNKEQDVPIDKEIYNSTIIYESKEKIDYEKYDYKLNGNILTFTHDFDREEYNNSAAVSNCYKKLNVENYNNALLISTSTQVNCFDLCPSLNKVTVTVETDKKVIDHNADKADSGKYIWYLERGKDSRKPINMTIDNTPVETETEEENNNSTSNTVNPQNNNNNKTEKKTDYTMVIFALVLLIVMLPAYYFYNKIKKKNNEMDD